MIQKLQIQAKSYQYSINVIKFLNKIKTSPSTKIIRDQAIRSVTSIGANIVESKYSGTRKDFINFRRHSLKSANETLYWLSLVKDLGLCEHIEADHLIREGVEIVKILYVIINRLRVKN